MPRRRPLGGARDLPPLKIIRKILLLQLAYYGTASVLILFTTVVYGTVFSFDLILSWDAVRGDTTVGWMLGLVWVLSSLISVIFLLLLVSRSKLIPDFALTIHFLHLIATSLYTHAIPTNWLWWGLQCASASLMTFMGIWACRWRELRPIAFGGNGSASTALQTAASGDAANGHPQEDGEHESFTLSRGRGRGRNLHDGGGEYEMVQMKEETGSNAV
ncbi:hypothetical protein ASPZODRAFT_127501 [Penicilliopsis zonata CBS 506.65]|uniref:Protein SYS1 n=1 Tax=Penicilliopsis zonata CBS 506.65 TaxID=1073090 RepID=A0A1L9SW51_9EURO|nr:hypothetical protein ASPZODRAFT_127501 [Penicilliopsis zonata CBS 506.65]OJJ51430.1 hypothetical protein ASPZODRAFT_127501 [Penicilliopsis zonata CBS 506.65]